METTPPTITEAQATTKQDPCNTLI
jgi:hypothetical protein